MIRALLILLSLTGLPLAVGQDLKPATFAVPAGCRIVKPAEYLDEYFVCGPNPKRADILQISYGENGPKVHIFTSRAARAKYFALIAHENCADFQLAQGSREDRLIQKHFRKHFRKHAQ